MIYIFVQIVRGLNLLLTLLFLASCLFSPSSPPTLLPPTTRATQSPNATFLPPEVALQLVAEGFVSAVAMVPSPDGRFFIIDQIGMIYILTAEGEVLAEPFLDIREQMVQLMPEHDERGLLGMALHPAFLENGRFFVYYPSPVSSSPQGRAFSNHLSEFRVSDSDPNSAEPDSERILLILEQIRPHHTGGALTFGPDGYLYLSVGDGGGVGDPNNYGQSLEVLFGKILRLDVDHGAPYSIPSDNPFVGKEGRDEIFAYGFREPYRFSFDQGEGHRFFVADVGQAVKEEVNIVTIGGNYGWKIREGTTCFNPNRGVQREPLASCPDSGAKGEPLIGPIIEYDHDVGVAIVGGYIYRGSAIPGMYGQYIFGDWGLEQGKLFVAMPAVSEEGMWSMEELRIAESSQWDIEGLHILGFGQDEEGEVYVLTSAMAGPKGNTGQIFKIVPAP